MRCPICGETDSKVIDTTEVRYGIRRRRECKNCTMRFTTYERALTATPVLVKTNGNREEFDREKLKRGIWMACAKRPVPALEVERLTSRIETHLQSLGKPEVSSRVVGDMVVNGLIDLDPIAYIRYAIVYLGLDDLASVRAEIDSLLSEQERAADPTDNPEADSDFSQPTPVRLDTELDRVDDPSPSIADIGTLSRPLTMC
jgi:transcriptional repressor NrdR